MSSMAKPKPSLGPRLRGRLVETSGSLGQRYRDRRWSIFRDCFPGIEEMEVIDLGGTVGSWLSSPVKPRRVVVLNVTDEPGDRATWIDAVRGDACELPRRLDGARFDLVFSNSVIEHVGGHQRRAAFASNVHALADRHWVQTPYRYFPVEPHWLFPGFQFLPVLVRALIYQRWPLAHSRPSSRGGAVSSVMGTELLSITEMRHYFPDSQLVRERLGLLTKSIVLVRQ